MRTRFRPIYWIGLWIGLLAGLSSCTSAKPTGQLNKPPTPAILPTPTIRMASPGPSTVVAETAALPLELIQTALPPTRQSQITAPVPQITPTYLPASGPALAFLKNGDIWLLDEPGSEPYPLTIAGDILGFTWTPDGERLIAYNGTSLCFYQRDGSIRTACLELGLNEEQSSIERRLVISPDQRWVVLWNPGIPQEPGSIGWMVVALDTSNIMYRIEDPVDWGATFGDTIVPGGFTGQPVFLSDGRLLGTLSHPTLCSGDECNYLLFEFDLIDHQFVALKPGASSEFSFGAGVTLAGDGLTLVNLKSSIQDCEVFTTSVILVHFGPESVVEHPMDGLLIPDISFDRNQNLAVFSNTSACSPTNPVVWQKACGLEADSQVFPIRIWDLTASTQKELFPGLKPEFSPDEKWVAFLSCLTLDDLGEWKPGEASPPNIYLYQIEEEKLLQITDGAVFEWRP